MSVYLEKLAEFSALLRTEGLAVGLQETADACKLLSELDLKDRSAVCLALQAVYAKSREEQALFQRAFDGFFVSAEKRDAFRRQREEEARELARRRAEAEADMQVNGQPLDLREDLREVYVRMGDDKREQLRQILEKARMNVDRSPKLYGNFIRSVFMRFLLEQQMTMEDAAMGREEAADPDLALLYRDISLFKDSDIPKAAALIEAISRQLDAELSRRRQSRGHSGKLDFKRTIRGGLETGGSFYRLSYRRKRRSRRRLVLLCDVSGSMLQFSEFALRFIKSMSEISESSQTFLFSEEVRLVDPFALQNMDAFRDYVRASGLFGRGTDLGSALEELCRRRPAPLGPAATLLILSDTKTIDVPRAARSLLEARRQAGRVLWLNPIPQRKWPYVNSIQTMASLCRMAPCSTLDELARACRKMMK
ncbi:MAG: VWA domain-containing protein [Oscillospiraceae bacterium]|nr:VWA domain-containing protein [Oscillospiraceae bacterium]